MSLTIESTRFGTLEIPSAAVLEFHNGLIGLGGSRYALVAKEEDSVFLWLHSLDDPSIALPVVNPWRFFGRYEVELSDAEAERIGISDPGEAEVYVTVTAAETVEDFSANLRAPILVSGGKGYQVINEAPDAEVRMPLFAEVAVEAAA
jgi:flagellar assembly factor FliW